VVALAGAGAAVTLANRTQSRAMALAEEVKQGRMANSVRTIGLEPQALGAALAEADLLVNTTSLGMSPDLSKMPPVPPEAFHPGLFVYDLIYNPLQTRLLRTAQEHGARGTHGAGMLARQGALALELWTGRTAPAALMEEVIIKGVGLRV
jgi:shikimate dehydrogenase